MPAGAAFYLAHGLGTGRKALLVELDPKYCDVIRARWARFSAAACRRVCWSRSMMRAAV